MKLETATVLAASILGSICSQSMVCHNLPLGENGYYVLYTHQNRPISEMHRFDCSEISDEKEALEMLDF